MNLVLGITGASGAHAAERLVEKSPWPVTVVATRHGREVFEFECGRPFAELADRAAAVHENDDLWSPLASGSVSTVGMVVLPCSVNCLGKVATGNCDTLLTRAAHCHLKSRRPVILCLRETPLTAIDYGNAREASLAGAVVMPLSPPFYMFHGRSPDTVSMTDLLDAYVDRVLQLLGHDPARTWETVR